MAKFMQCTDIFTDEKICINLQNVSFVTPQYNVNEKTFTREHTTFHLVNNSQRSSLTVKESYASVVYALGNLLTREMT